MICKIYWAFSRYPASPCSSTSSSEPSKQNLAAGSVPNSRTSLRSRLASRVVLFIYLQLPQSPPIPVATSLSPPSVRRLNTLFHFLSTYCLWGGFVGDFSGAIFPPAIAPARWKFKRQIGPKTLLSPFERNDRGGGHRRVDYASPFFFFFRSVSALFLPTC